MDIFSINNQVNSCKRCELYKLAPGGAEPLAGTFVGDNDVKVMVIADSINFENMILQDHSTTLGQKALLKLLEDCKLKSYYLTRIMKCHTETSYKKCHINSCKNWAIEEIRAIAPQLVILSGLNSFKIVFPDIKNATMKDVAYSPIVFTENNTRIVAFPIFAGNFYSEMGRSSYIKAVEKISKQLKNQGVLNDS